MSARTKGAILGLAGLAGVAAVAVGLGSEGDREAAPLRLSDSTWRKSQSGVEVVQADLRQGESTRGRLVAIYLDLDRIRPRLFLNEHREALERLLDPAFVVVNAGYFTRENRPTGLLASGGKILHPFIKEAGGAGSGVLVVKAGQVRLLERDDVRRGDLEAVELAIQAGPRVIEADGSQGIRSDDGMRANRTVLGRDRAGRLAVVVIHAPDAGLTLGPTLYELQRILGPEGLGAVDSRLALDAALNLDGGPSTGLHARPPAVRIDLPASSRVVSALAFEPRTP